MGSQAEDGEGSPSPVTCSRQLMVPCASPRVGRQAAPYTGAATLVAQGGRHSGEALGLPGGVLGRRLLEAFLCRDRLRSW